MLKHASRLFFPVLALIVVSTNMANAQTFDVALGSQPLGNLTFGGDSGDAMVRTTLNRTPLGVFNGTFVGISRPFQTDEGTIVRQYFSESIFPRKTRQISLLMDQGQVIETIVSPQSERTNISNPTEITGTVIDPVTALGLMVSASGCPAAFRIYDGRRVIVLAPTGSTSEKNTLECDMYYSVDAGPGHLSPLYIKEISVILNYDVAGGRQELMNMRFRSGIFSLVLTRQR